jgi:hypothetical protein
LSDANHIQTGTIAKKTADKQQTIVLLFTTNTISESLMQGQVRFDAADTLKRLSVV